MRYIKKMRNIVRGIVLLFFGVCSSGFAQQDASYTQYMYNTMSINPAYAGSRGRLSFNALYRTQWVGVDGAPTSQTFNISSPITKRVGLGVSIVNDEIGNGTSQETDFGGVFSYTIPVNYNAKLAFGLKAGGRFLNVDFNKLRNLDPRISLNVPNIDNKFSPNFGVGAFYHTAKFYTGISVPNILETKHFSDSDGNSSNVRTEKMHLYLISGYVFNLNSNIMFKPAILYKLIKGSPMSLDVSANFFINYKFRVGAAYRVNSSFSGLLGFDLNDQLMIGMSYDHAPAGLMNIISNARSYEFFLRYEFSSKKKIMSPKFF